MLAWLKTTYESQWYTDIMVVHGRNGLNIGEKEVWTSFASVKSAALVANHVFTCLGVLCTLNAGLSLPHI